MKQFRMAVALALVAASTASAQQVALPRVPKMVEELYLPEEQAACEVLYRLYAALPAGDLAGLHGGGPVYLDDKGLARGATAKLAAWFNSARWGCEPPAEELDSGTASRAVMALTSEDRVVEFALQSPKKKIWKKLTIACAPERGEWVRDGLPLLPAWFLVPWEGGLTPPPLESVLKDERRPAYRRCYEFPYRTLRCAYGVYAGFSSDSLRKLHREHELTLRFEGLLLADRQRLADAWDQDVLDWNRCYAAAPDLGRTSQLRAMLFGITRVTLLYVHADTQAKARDAAWPQGTSGLESFPRPQRAVYLHFDPLVVRHRKPGMTINPPLSALVHRESSYLIAWSPEIQREVISWRKAWNDWRKRWMIIPPSGFPQRMRPGAPPWPPRTPWGEIPYAP